MAAPPENIRSDRSDNVMTAWGRWFTRPNARGSIRPAMKVRKDPFTADGRIVPPPIFSGSWQFSHYVGQDLDIQTRTNTHLRLHLNPTRFARHQPSMPWRESRQPWPLPILFAEKASPEVNREIVLNDIDNWIPSVERMLRFTDSSRWQRHVARFFDAISDEFELELDRACETYPGPEVERTGHAIKLGEVETYWEFAAENSTGLVSTLEPLLKSFSRRERTTRQFSQDLDRSIDRNALSISVEVNPGRKIRIYAKTNRRVRIEVIHKLTGWNHYKIEGGRNARDSEELLGILSRLAQNAAELVNRMFQHLRLQSTIDIAQLSALELVTEICRHSRSTSTAFLILSLLLSHNSITPIGMDKKTRRALQRLSGGNVLTFNSSNGNYTLTAKRRDALQRIKATGGITFLAARERARANPETGN